MTLERRLQESKFLAVNCIFLAAYFIPVGLVVGTYLAWCGYIPRIVGMILLAIVTVDWLIPLPKAPHFNSPYCWGTGIEEGMKTYCDGELRLAAEFEKDRNYLVCIAPHGLWTMCYHLLWPTLVQKFGITPTIVGADVLLKIPIFKRHFAAYGVVGASKKQMSQAMNFASPHNVTIFMPGGIAEMFYGVTREQIILNKRKGFVKLALQQGCDLVPAYGFGSNQQYRRIVEAGGTLAKISSVLKISITPWMDRFYIPFGFVPTTHKVILAVGKPIRVEKVADPTEAQVNELHARFCDAMRALFDEHKAAMGWQEKRLYLEDEAPQKKDKTQ